LDERTQDHVEFYVAPLEIENHASVKQRKFKVINRTS